jgi:hypothetical protein
MITAKDFENSEEVISLIKHSGHALEVMGYTEHGLRHAKLVSSNAKNVLAALGHSQKMQELAGIAGLLHDIGNTVNRFRHGLTGAIMAEQIMTKMGMPIEDRLVIMSAIGNHEEEIGTVISAVSAALVIADKADAHRTRVGGKRTIRPTHDDIHDRVNYAIKKNFLVVDGEKHVIASKYYMDSTASVMDFLNIYLTRILMSEKAAKFLGCSFRLYINDVLINTVNKYTEEKIKKIREDGKV